MKKNTSKVIEYIEWLVRGENPDEVFYVESILSTYLTKPAKPLEGVLDLSVALEGFDRIMLKDHNAEPVNLYQLEKEGLIDLEEYEHSDLKRHDHWNTYEQADPGDDAFWCDYGRRYYRVNDGDN